jgi:hypothetical protein
MAELVVLLPVLKRPHRVEPVLRSLFATVPKARVVFITDPEDYEERKQVQAATEVFGGVEELVFGGTYPKKINEGVRQTTEPLLLFGADDLEFHPGWFEAAKAKLTEGIGVVATEDLCNPRVARGELATHPLVTREYTKRGTIDNPDLVLCEQYKHEYCDRELSETAQYRNAFAYAPDSIVEHLHPMVGKAPNDELYDRIWDRMYQGRRVYNRRMSKWGMTTAKVHERHLGDKEQWAKRSR